MNVFVGIVFSVATDENFIAVGISTAKAHPESSAAARLPADEVSNTRANSSRPAWLLTLEIATGVVVGMLFLIALFTASKKWKRKPSIIIPWKKSSSSKDYMSIHIGSYLLIILINLTLSLLHTLEPVFVHSMACSAELRWTILQILNC